ncbi:Methyltransferase domain-containing protein [Acetobacteraceae bacterium EV16G]|uniref:Methyltransferase domain-containing protein n=1 Tax=Sorlinia euscelidii TaxID=3081148 RepID=A0ABU7U387_9PROT
MSRRAEQFDEIYAANIDPWGFRTTAYERDKYEATLAVLPRPVYQLGIEAGCSIGELTRLLAPRCRELIGIDVSDVALREASRRNAEFSHVHFIKGELPAEWPDVGPDLIILSEVLYFLSESEIRMLARRIALRWQRKSHCVLVNYLGDTRQPLQGPEAADIFRHALSDADHILRSVLDGFQIDLIEAH